MCHGYPPVEDVPNSQSTNGSSGLVDFSTGSVTAGAHELHARTKGYDCTGCHFDSAGRSITHGDSFITIGFSMFNDTVQGGSYDGQLTAFYNATAATMVSNSGTKRCGNIYCHSSGQGSTASDATPVYANPQWDDPATGACGTCHMTVTASTLGAIDTGSHTSHLDASAVVNGCGDCHTGAADDASSYDSENHVNMWIDVAHFYTADGQAGNGYGTCSAAACHGSGTPHWGDNSGTGCTVCHGDQTNLNSAPGPDTAGDTAPNDQEVGAHQAHLQALSNISLPVNCSECHTVPAVTVSAGHINDLSPGVAELTFGVLASANSVNPGYNAGTGQCSTTYCHGGAMPAGSDNGKNVVPSWNDTAYLTGIATLDGDCSQCHGSPPNNAPHNATMTLIQCALCHDHFNEDGTLNDLSLHVDGTVQATGCDTCHGFPPATGAHFVHINDAVMTCTDCHAAPGQSPGHLNGMTEVAVNQKYAYVAGNPAYNSSSMSCSNVNCHIRPTPAWSCDDDQTGFVCNNCHGSSPVDGAPPPSLTGNVLPADPKVGAHQAHLNAASNLSAPVSCSECHIVPPTVVVPGHYDDGDNTAEVTFGPLAGNSSGYSFITGECSSTYCHSGAEGGSGPTPLWSDANYLNGTNTDCGKCHGVPPATSSHGGITPGDLDSCALCHDHWTGASFTDPTLHINGKVEGGDCVQ
jgi:predicted CxxxxCH...CXXCH cytochrome family protein